MTDIARSLQIFGPSGSVYSPPCKHEDSIAYGVRLSLWFWGGGKWRGGVAMMRIKADGAQVPGSRVEKCPAQVWSSLSA